MAPQTGDVGRAREERAAERFSKILSVIDKPFRRSDPPPKTILFELFGSGKVLKTTLGVKLRQFFSRYGARVMLPPESAELEDIRGMSEDDVAAFQELHVAHVLENVLKYSESRVFHVAIIDRGLLDMRAWFLRLAKKDKMSEDARRRYDELLLESPAMFRMDAAYFLTAAPEVSWAREIDGSLTRRGGRKMNLTGLRQMAEIWEEVYADTKMRFPEFPLLRVDTNDGNIERCGWEVLEHLLGSLEKKFDIK